MVKKTYKQKVLCKSCSNVIWFNIPKGKKKNIYLKENRICPVCKQEHGGSNKNEQK